MGTKTINENVKMHIKKHHKKYLGGLFAGFAIVKTVIVLAGILVSISNNFSNIFAAEPEHQCNDCKLTQEICDNYEFDSENCACIGSMKGCNDILNNSMGFNIEHSSFSYTQWLTYSNGSCSANCCDSCELSTGKCQEINSNMTFDESTCSCGVSSESDYTAICGEISKNNTCEELSLTGGTTHFVYDTEKGYCACAYECCSCNLDATKCDMLGGTFNEENCACEEINRDGMKDCEYEWKSLLNNGVTIPFFLTFNQDAKSCTQGCCKCELNSDICREMDMSFNKDICSCTTNVADNCDSVIESCKGIGEDLDGTTHTMPIEGNDGSLICACAYECPEKEVEKDTTPPICQIFTYTPSCTNGTITGTFTAYDTGGFAGGSNTVTQSIAYTSNGSQSVTFTDAAGNSVVCPGTVTGIDNAAPNTPTVSLNSCYTGTNITVGVESAVNDNGCNGSVQYQFCKATSNSAGTCGYPNLTSWSSNTTETINNVSDGNYIFVRARDGLGNRGSWSAGVQVTIDTTAPTVTITSNGSGTCQKGGTAYTVTGTFSEYVNNFVVGDITATNGTKAGFVSTSNPIFKWTVSSPSTAGTYGTTTVTIPAGVATDNCNNGNTASNSITWQYDNAGPNGTINASVIGTTIQLTLNATDVGCSSVSQMQFSCNNSTWCVAEPYATNKNFALGSYTNCGCTTGDGSHTIYVRYKDALGNWGNETSDTFDNSENHGSPENCCSLTDKICDNLGLVFDKDTCSCIYKNGESIDDCTGFMYQLLGLSFSEGDSSFTPFMTFDTESNSCVQECCTCELRPGICENMNMEYNETTCSCGYSKGRETNCESIGETCINLGSNLDGTTHFFITGDKTKYCACTYECPNSCSCGLDNEKCEIIGGSFNPETCSCELKGDKNSCNSGQLNLLQQNFDENKPSYMPYLVSNVSGDKVSCTDESCSCTCGLDNEKCKTIGMVFDPDTCSCGVKGPVISGKGDGYGLEIAGDGLENPTFVPGVPTLTTYEEGKSSCEKMELNEGTTHFIGTGDGYYTCMYECPKACECKLSEKICGENKFDNESCSCIEIEQDNCSGLQLNLLKYNIEYNLGANMPYLIFNESYCTQECCTCELEEEMCTNLGMTYDPITCSCAITKGKNKASCNKDTETNCNKLKASLSSGDVYFVDDGNGNCTCMYVCPNEDDGSISGPQCSGTISAPSCISGDTIPLLLNSVGDCDKFVRFSCNGTNWSDREGYNNNNNFNFILGNYTGFGCNTDDGSHNIFVQFLDLSGNRSSSTTVSVSTDNTAPTTTASISPSNWSCTSGNVTVTFSTGANGCNSTNTTRYCTGANTCTPNITGTSVTISAVAGGVATGYVRFSSIDGLGNAETPKSTGLIYIDKAGPNGTISTTNSITNETIPLTLNITNDVGCSNVSQMQFSCNGNNWSDTIDFQSPIDLNLSDYSDVGCSTNEGSHTIYVQFIDELGNVGNPASASFNIESPEEPRMCCSITKGICEIMGMAYDEINCTCTGSLSNGCTGVMSNMLGSYFSWTGISFAPYLVFDTDANSCIQECCKCELDSAKCKEIDANMIFDESTCSCGLNCSKDVKKNCENLNLTFDEENCTCGERDNIIGNDGQGIVNGDESVLPSCESIKQGCTTLDKNLTGSTQYIQDNSGHCACTYVCPTCICDLNETICQETMGGYFDSGSCSCKLDEGAKDCSGLQLALLSYNWSNKLPSNMSYLVFNSETTTCSHECCECKLSQAKCDTLGSGMIFDSSTCSCGLNKAGRDNVETCERAQSNCENLITGSTHFFMTGNSYCACAYECPQPQCTGTISTVSCISGTTIPLSLNTNGSCSKEILISCDNSHWMTGYFDGYYYNLNLATSSVAGCTTGDGSHTIYVQYQDTNGYRSSSATVTVNTDNTAPTTTASISPSNWSCTSGNVTVTLSAGANGCNSSNTTRYCTGANTCTPNITGTSVTISAVAGGVATGYVRFSSIDGLGNAETPKSTGLIYIDKAGPNGTISTTNSITNETIPLTLNITNDVGCSNINQMQFSCNGSDWSESIAFQDYIDLNLGNYSYVGCSTSEGSHTIYVQFIDGLGNIGEQASAQYIIESPEEPRMCCSITKEVCEKINMTYDEINCTCTGSISNGCTGVMSNMVWSYFSWTGVSFAPYLVFDTESNSCVQECCNSCELSAEKCKEIDENMIFDESTCSCGLKCSNDVKKKCSELNLTFDAETCSCGGKNNVIGEEGQAAIEGDENELPECDKIREKCNNLSLTGSTQYIQNDSGHCACTYVCPTCICDLNETICQETMGGTFDAETCSCELDEGAKDCSGLQLALLSYNWNNKLPSNMSYLVFNSETTTCSHECCECKLSQAKCDTLGPGMIFDSSTCSCGINKSENSVETCEIANNRCQNLITGSTHFIMTGNYSYCACMYECPQPQCTGTISTVSCISGTTIPLSLNTNGSCIKEILISCDNSHWMTGYFDGYYYNLNLATSSVAGCTTGDGLHTIYVQFLDISGIASNTVITTGYIDNTSASFSSTTNPIGYECQTITGYAIASNPGCSTGIHYLWSGINVNIYSGGYITGYGLYNRGSGSSTILVYSFDSSWNITGGQTGLTYTWLDSGLSLNATNPINGGNLSGSINFSQTGAISLFDVNDGDCGHSGVVIVSGYCTTGATLQWTNANNGFGSGFSIIESNVGYYGPIQCFIIFQDDEGTHTQTGIISFDLLCRDYPCCLLDQKICREQGLSFDQPTCSCIPTEQPIDINDCTGLMVSFMGFSLNTGSFAFTPAFIFDPISNSCHQECCECELDERDCSGEYMAFDAETCSCTVKIGAEVSTPSDFLQQKGEEACINLKELCKTWNFNTSGYTHFVQSGDYCTCSFECPNICTCELNKEICRGQGLTFDQSICSCTGEILANSGCDSLQSALLSYNINHSDRSNVGYLVFNENKKSCTQECCKCELSHEICNEMGMSFDKDTCSCGIKTGNISVCKEDGIEKRCSGIGTELNGKTHFVKGNDEDGYCACTYECPKCTGSITVNPSCVTGTTIPLTLDKGSCNNKFMRFSCDGTNWSGPIDFPNNNTYSFDLLAFSGFGCTTGNESHTIYVQYEDDNGNRGDSTSTTFTVDTIPPTITLTSDLSGSCSTGGIWSVTGTWSEPVNGFTSGDIVITNGTLGGFSSISQIIYNWNITTPSVGTGRTSIFIPAGVVTDSCGNPNLTSNILTGQYDNVGPNQPRPISNLGCINGEKDRLEWDAPGGIRNSCNNNILGYEIWICDTIACTGVVASGTTNASITGWDIPANLPDGTYFWIVRAQDQLGNRGAWSDTISFSQTVSFTIDNSGPSFYTGLNPTGYECQTITGYAVANNPGCSSDIYYLWSGINIHSLGSFTGYGLYLNHSGISTLTVYAYDSGWNDFYDNTGLTYTWLDSGLYLNATNPISGGNLSGTIDFSQNGAISLFDVNDGDCGHSGVVIVSGYCTTGALLSRSGYYGANGSGFVINPDENTPFEGTGECYIIFQDDEGTHTQTGIVEFYADNIAPTCVLRIPNGCTSGGIIVTLSGTSNDIDSHSWDNFGESSGATGSKIFTGNGIITGFVYDLFNNSGHCTGEITGYDDIAPSLDTQDWSGDECSTGVVMMTGYDNGCNSGTIFYNWQRPIDYNNYLSPSRITSIYEKYSDIVSTFNVSGYVGDSAGNQTGTIFSFTWNDVILTGNWLTGIGIISDFGYLVNDWASLFNASAGSCETIQLSGNVTCSSGFQWSGNSVSGYIVPLPDNTTYSTGICTGTVTDGDTSQIGTVEFSYNTDGISCNITVYPVCSNTGLTLVMSFTGADKFKTGGNSWINVGGLTGTQWSINSTGIYTGYVKRGENFSNYCTITIDENHLDTEGPTFRNTPNIFTGYECENIYGYVEAEDLGCGSGTIIYSWSGINVWSGTNIYQSGTDITGYSYTGGNRAGHNITGSLEVSIFDGLGNTGATKQIQYVRYDTGITLNTTGITTPLLTGGNNSYTTGNVINIFGVNEGNCGSGYISIVSVSCENTGATISTGNNESIIVTGTDNYSGTVECYVVFADDDGNIETGYIDVPVSTRHLTCLENWDNDYFLTGRFWGLWDTLQTGEYKSGSLICALYGSGNNDPTAYTTGRVNWDRDNDCDVLNMAVIESSTLPDIIPENTIYVLDNDLATAGIKIHKCSAIVTKSGQTISKLTSKNNFVIDMTGRNSIIDSIFINGSGLNTFGINIYNDDISINFLKTYNGYVGINIIGSYILLNNTQTLNNKNGIIIWHGVVSVNNSQIYNNGIGLSMGHNNGGNDKLGDLGSILINNTYIYNNLVGSDINSCSGLLNDVSIFNNKSGIVIEGSNITSYGYMKYFGNEPESNILNSISTGSLFAGWSDGHFDTGDTVNYDIMTKPSIIAGKYLYGRDFDFDAHIGLDQYVISLGDITSYSYGIGITGYTQAVALKDGNNIAKPGKEIPNYYIGSQMPRMTFTVESSGSDNIYDILATGSTNPHVTGYQLFGSSLSGDSYNTGINHWLYGVQFTGSSPFDFVTVVSPVY